ncbi:MAG: hypothetical protein ACTHLW_12465, partial [Verrucomicrobiota bacterium]
LRPPTEQVRWWFENVASAAPIGLRIFLAINPGHCPGLSSVGLSALSISVNQRLKFCVSAPLL